MARERSQDHNKNQDKNQSKEGDEDQPGVLETVQSVLAAFFGVQSTKNRERDFTKGRAGTFIIVGTIMTALFVLVLYLVVRMVVSMTAP